MARPRDKPLRELRRPRFSKPARRREEQPAARRRRGTAYFVRLSGSVKAWRGVHFAPTRSLNN